MSKYVELQYNIWKKLEENEVKEFLLTKDYFQGVGLLPGIIKPSGLKDIKLSKITYKGKDLPARTSPIKIITPKSDKNKRVFSLIHPYSYIHLVNEIVSKDTWGAIKNKLSSKTLVSVYSLPLFGHNILNEEKGWTFFSQLDPIDMLLHYPVEIELDIQNFYSSIYTHSISWAFLGKTESRNHPNDYTLFSNRLDKLFQNSNDGQTNGIHIGNEISNIISEIILKDIDEIITKKLNGLKLDIKILRFRDDYKIFCNNQDEPRKIIEVISEIIYENYGFVINDVKTKIHKQQEDEFFYLQHTARSIIKNYFNLNSEEDIYLWEGEDLFNFLNDIINIHTYIKDKNYLNNRISDLLRKIRDKKVTISSLDKWTSPIFSLILSSINNNSIQNTYGFALLEKLIFILKEEDLSICKNMTEKIVLLYNDAKYNYADLWIFMICKAYDNDYAKEFLNKNDSVLLKMIKNRKIPNCNFFESRDILKPQDILELNKFSLIDFEELSQKNVAVIDSIDEVSFNSWAIDWYMSR